MPSSSFKKGKIHSLYNLESTFAFFAHVAYNVKRHDVKSGFGQNAKC